MIGLGTDHVTSCWPMRGHEQNATGGYIPHQTDTVTYRLDQPRSRFCLKKGTHRGPGVCDKLRYCYMTV